MFGNDDQQSQGTTSNNGFSPDNFTPPASLTSAPLSNTVDPTLPTNNGSTVDPSSAPSVPTVTDAVNTSEEPTKDSPDHAVSSNNSSSNDQPSGDLPVDHTTSGTDNELLDLKQQALQQLSPLVDQLDQTPEEKFRTTMMMIQASDNQSLLKIAYDAAQAISDEKERAQALLDVINEINYFTQHPQA